MSKQILIGPIHQAVTFRSTDSKGPLKRGDLDIEQNCGILIIDDQIIEIGEWELLKEKYDKDDVEVEMLSGDYIALPGFIDAHTHICFAGSRANDYALRNAGISYLEIAKNGGGIWDTVTKTREASEVDLVNGIVDRAELLLRRGITTIEVKSGYGLSIKEELKMLRAIKKANKKTSADLVSTCLAAHIKPKDFLGSHGQYLEHIAKELFPLLVEESLTNRIDAFIEEEAFSSSVVSPYFEAAKIMGFELTVHADQFHPGGSQVAVDHACISADHLEASGDKEIALLADSDVIAVALPGASIGLGCAFTPARKLLDAGVSLVIASDWNPGSAPMGNLVAQASILGAFEKLTNAEVLAGLCIRAAKALGLNDRGRLVTGQKADIILYKTTDLDEILYHQGSLLPSIIIKRGQKVV